MFINDQFTQFMQIPVVEFKLAEKWLIDNDHKSIVDALSEHVNLYVYPDESVMVLKISTMEVFMDHDMIIAMNQVVPFIPATEDRLFTPFTEVADNEIERVESTGSLF